MTAFRPDIMQSFTDSSMVVAIGGLGAEREAVIPMLHERFVNGLGAAVITDLKSIPATIKPLDLKDAGRIFPPPPGVRIQLH